MAEPSAAEQRWLQAARDFALRALPARPEPGGTPLDAVLRCVRSAGGGDLPLGYSFISISDLKHQQHTPCCSHLTWSTNKFKEWAHQGRGALPMHSSLPRAYLILVGYLTDGRQEDKDGCLYVKDNTGIIPCELLHFELEWLESLFLFPNWVYIPQTDRGAAGYVEILVDPVPVNCLPKEVSETIPVIYPPLAEPLLVSRIPCKKRSKLNVAGELSRLSPLLCIHQKTFFFLFLKCFTSAVWVPVLVKKPNQLAWHHTLQLGHRYTITGLSISSLKKSGQRIFVTSVSSCLLPYCAEQVKEQALDSSWQGESSLSASLETTQQLSDSSELSIEEWPGSIKESKIISYVGTVTKILNAQAGLYELDSKVCLCLAYQQLLNSARGIQPGACVELIDVHLLQKPLASSPFIVLGACLHSTVMLRSFSRLSTPYQPPVTSRNLYLQLLFRYNLGMPLYLWLVSLLETFEERCCSNEELTYIFQVRVQYAHCFPPQLWSHTREAESLPELEEASHGGGEGMTQQEALLLFMGKSLQWFPFLHLDGLYRFIVPCCSDLEVFEKLSFPPVPAEFLGRPSCPLCLPVQDNWHLLHETWVSFPAERQLAARAVLTGMDQRISSIPEILSNRFVGLPYT
ncbi:CST complex subunit CTC1 [Numida meleagris]|uniref:CST complex subunit CTC1 n=1 Tax=Numida meleagris TaxID=8996 RepID=UPI000B3DFE6F|nr:CST complex subunit CTC1 [Numida meleagris]